MGYYINETTNGPLSPKHKVVDLIKYENAIIIQQPIDFDSYKDRAIICVVDNGFFQAAAYAFNKDEFEVFNRIDDTRPKTWLVMNKERAKELSGYIE